MNNEPEKMILAEEKTPEEDSKDTLMEQIKGLRIDQKITPEQLIPEEKKQKQSIINKHQKLLFFVLLITSAINAGCFVVLLFF